MRSGKAKKQANSTIIMRLDHIIFDLLTSRKTRGRVPSKLDVAGPVVHEDGNIQVDEAGVVRHLGKKHLRS